ncbi:MAG: toprim domain-containing protein [Aquificae bacterium]|nr:toprim domain-containing protein [Aquificota bacterium]
MKSLKEWAQALRAASADAVVLVEGKNDKKALERLFVRNVYTLAGRRLTDLPDFLEKKARKVILLFDLDREGEEITRKVREILEAEGFEVDEKFRKALRDLHIIYIEEIHGEGRQAKNP